MPSPFPGMDPYLENPASWPDVHHSLISSIRDQLVGRIAPRYYVRIEERVYLVDDGDPARSVIVPDLRIGLSPSEPPMRSGGVLAVAEPVEVITMLDPEIREARLMIVDAVGRDVVTAIEVLSPANKVMDGAGWRNYRNKRREILDSGTHFVEIDLLREGDSPTAAQAPGPCEYRVHVSQVRRRPRGWVWAIRLEQQLPVIRIPLRDSDPDTELDLQAALNDTYDRARYGDRIDYRKAPVPPLTAPLSQWAEKLLKEKGLR
jgi:hypothetical protein